MSMKLNANLFLGVATISFLFLAAVCWHSVGEIHYLKSFFPRQFTVEEAYAASRVELIKVLFITLPLAWATTCAYLYVKLQNFTAPYRDTTNQI